MTLTPLILPASADECRWRSPSAYYFYKPLRPLLLISSHSSSVKVNVREHGCSMSLVTKLWSVTMIACAVAQDSAELGQNDLDNLFVSHVQEDYGTWRVVIFLKLWRTKFMYRLTRHGTERHV